MDSLHFVCHKTGGWLINSRRVLKRIKKMIKIVQNLCLAI